MLVIQDPSDRQTSHVLESLLTTFQSAERIAGAFAFATATGVDLLTNDEAFRNVARQHPVDLIVGLDAITNLRALDSLQAVAGEFFNVTVRAFLNPVPGTTFHPKFCWARNRRGGHLVIGSGNLTGYGLWNNWEAYSVEALDLAGIASVEATWNDWVNRHQSFLRPLDDAEVRRWASQNVSPFVREGDTQTLVATGASTRRESAAAESIIPSATEVLVAEISSGGNRWQQGNFRKADYEGFFGAQPGLLFLFRYVAQDGSLSDYERGRPPVVVVSRNFRFELGGEAGVPYPDPRRGRPIGVFLRIAPRNFLYRLMLPDDEQYGQIRDLLVRRKGPPAANMRTTRMDMATLRTEWPEAPFWRITSTD